ncbi:aminotransferase class I/II-fold pyridoxal phosphate-dependent enzyme [Sphingomonas prati]|uniref:Aminotransferase n=1 Tax=Sphingomonas prati TaxID=1843237 RepID=A0A7W9F234_9SPHN|nr:aminotransferase class I/II-fold pyridoxal phosphate-dependent enzyme [Sphingomonas prati]MBB5728075.1 cobalamin biosynthetic protein CobC [Sphingomonas prati]GGE83050.1 threonine-phosphate decarboxylase [Sphingomonas prati]
MVDSGIDAGILDTFCGHGGRVDAARAAFGGADWIDLSTGIAPWSWPVDGLSLGLERLPEPGAIAALEACAAAAFGADPAGVVAVPGTDLAMRVLAPLLGARRAAVLAPGYAGHRAAWPDAVAVADVGEVADHDLFVLASPANPDGRVADPAVLRGLAARMMVVVDEAYADPAVGLCGEASDGLIVLRSFGKFYGLPGLRLGFVVTGPGLAGRLRAMLGDWPVSSPAVAIGTAAYGDGDWRAAQAGRIAEAGAQLDAVLDGAGLAVVGRAPLFRLVGCERAIELFAVFARHAILTRPFAGRPDRLRIGLPRGTVEQTRLAAALAEFRT